MEVHEHPLFSGCDANALASLLRQLRPRRVRKGSLLIDSRRGPADLFLVLQGSLMAFGRTAGGRRVIFELTGPGELDGILAAAGRAGHYTQAAADSLVVPLSSADLGRLVAADPKVAVNLAELLMTRQEKREAQIEALAEAGTVQRLARQLLALARFLGKADTGGEIRVARLTHQTLADMVGLRRETVTVKLDELVAAGAVMVEGRQLRLRPTVLQDLLRRPDAGGREQ
jgi:CRP-like cAMP-binding protein